MPECYLIIDRKIFSGFFYPHREGDEDSALKSGGWVLGEGAASPSPPARGSGERCKITCKLLQKD